MVLSAKYGILCEDGRNDVFPEKEIKAAFRQGRQSLEKLEKDHPWEEHIESFDLPILGREIKLVVSSGDPNFFDTTKDVEASVATMSWTGKKFRLSKIKTPLIRKMSKR